MQEIDGKYNAQASNGSSATVNHYDQIFQMRPPQEVHKDTLAEALALFEQLPIDSAPQPKSLPPGSHMPLIRNALFVGREADLVRLGSNLKQGEVAAIGQSSAITGMGGIGKSQLASEFAFRYGQFFSGGVFWLNFSDADSIPVEIANCGDARALNLHPDFSSLPLDAQIGLVASTWNRDIPCLLIFDNCEDEELLERWAPRSGGARILVTTRKHEWRPELGVNTLPLGELTLHESVFLLHKHRPDLSESDTILRDIAKELGNLPLALHMAGSYLKRYQHSPMGHPTAYLKALCKPDLLQHHSMTLEGKSPTGHDQHVARTFALSFQKLGTTNAIDTLARGLLSYAAWFSPGEPIPRHLLSLSAGIHQDDATQSTLFEDGIRRLVGLGLIEQEEGGGLVLHRLLSSFAQSIAGLKDDTLETVAKALRAEAERLNAAGYPSPLLAWQPHLRAVADAAEKADLDDAGPLLKGLGYHLNMLADFKGAKAVFERALQRAKAVQPPNHSEVAISLNNLGSTLHALGDLKVAMTVHKRALQIRAENLSPNHLDIANSLTSIGSILRDQDNLEEAESLFRRSFAMTIKVSGPDHLNTAECYHNIGSILQNQNKFDEALLAYGHALRISEAILGPNHPKVAACLNNIGSTLNAQGKTDEAATAHERSLEINETMLGPHHLSVATSLNNIADLRKHQKDFRGALALLQRALKIKIASLGSLHPEISILYNNLASIQHELGKLEEAQASYKNAIRIAESSLGANHSSVAQFLANFGHLLADQNKLEEARGIIERALVIVDTMLSRDDILKANILNYRGGILAEQGRMDEAKASFEQGHSLLNIALGPHHPDTILMKNNHDYLSKTT